MNQKDLLFSGKQALIDCGVLDALIKDARSLTFAGQRRTDKEFRVIAYVNYFDGSDVCVDNKTTEGRPLIAVAFCDISSETGRIILLEKLVDSV